MRYAVALLSLLTTFSTHAEPSTPRGIVFAYECKQIDKVKTGFECQFNDGQLTLHRHERFADMTPERRDFAEYEYNKIALRYFELGGKAFQVAADFWDKGKGRTCGRVAGADYRISCADFSAD